MISLHLSKVCTQSRHLIVECLLMSHAVFKRFANTLGAKIDVDGDYGGGPLCLDSCGLALPALHGIVRDNNLFAQCGKFLGNTRHYVPDPIHVS